MKSGDSILVFYKSDDYPRFLRLNFPRTAILEFIDLK